MFNFDPNAHGANVLSSIINIQSGSLIVNPYGTKSHVHNKETYC